MKQFYKSLFIALSFLIFAVAGANAQQNRGTIKGKVLTSDNKAADFVSVGLKGTKYGAVTNENGEYTFRAPAGTYTLVVSSVGVESVETSVTVAANQTVNVSNLSLNTSMSQLAEVNVTANKGRFIRKASVDAAKIPLTALENAQSYSTVTNELLKEQQIFTVDDALRNAPGIQKLWDATGRGGDGGSYFTLRGFVVQSSLRNGVAGLVTSTVDGVNTDKIEVIKGPSGTLYGSALPSFGGLVNRVTKKPYETFGAEITHSLGSYDLNRTSIDVNTPLDTKKNVLFRLNSAYNFRHSFQNYGKSRSFALAPSLSVKASEKLSFLFEAEMFFGRSSSMRPFFFFYNTPKQMGVSKVSDLNIDYKQAYVNDDITQRSRSLNYFAQANYKISDKITSQTVFTSSNSFSNGGGPYFYLATDATAIAIAQGAGIALPDLPGNNNYIGVYDQSTANSKQGVIEVQQNFNGDFNIGQLRNRIVVGLDWQHVNSDQTYVSNTYGVAPINNPAFDYGMFNNLLRNRVNPTNLSNANTFVYKYKRNTYSAYVSDVLNITEQLLVSAGLRIDNFRYGQGYNFDGSPKESDPSFNQTALSPKFGVVYQALKEQLSFFANYQNGFVNPGYYLTAAGTSARADVQNANQIEGGVKMALFNGKLNGTISYYNIKLTNVLRAATTTGAAPNSRVQDGTQVSRGFEAEVVANPVTGLNVVAGFAYNNSKFTQADADVQGLRPNTAGSPYNANFYVSYRLPQTAINGLGVGFGGNYASENKIINSVGSGTFSLPSYTILNTNVFYDRAKYRFGLTANNVGNKRYYTGYTTINPQDLRQFILSATYKF